MTWTTGIGYRTDKVTKTPLDFSNPYEIYWDEANRGKTYLLDDSRDAPAHMLLKNGITNINTEDLGRHQAREGRAQVADRRRQRQALDGRLHEPAGGQGLGAPDVVGKRGLGPVVPAGRRRSRRRSDTGSRPDGRGTIGSDMIAVRAIGEEPRPRAPLPQLPARREERLRQLRELRRLPASAHEARSGPARG